VKVIQLSWKNKLARGVWTVAYYFLFRPFPTKVFNCWRIFILRCFGAKIHSRAGVYASCRIWAPWNLQLENNAWIGPYVDCYNVANVMLGAHVTISQYSYLCTASHDFTDIKHPLVAAPIEVKDHAWVAARAFVGPGVSIGEGAVIGACGVVIKDVEPWMVVAGNPAKPLKKREIRSA